ncbi:deleted in azoospermia protein 1-like [Pongo abelii]|uniref:deleted in azoospermia protein 1-like n=1 Tax=Pongo abelii TaxID=9601 RepID=UPI0023E814F1|nr:deleted in azoospermia protein 1-like [Pongo abelii]
MFLDRQCAHGPFGDLVKTQILIRVGDAVIPRRPPPSRGRERCHPLAEADTTRPDTRHRSHLPEAPGPRLSRPARLSLAVLPPRVHPPLVFLTPSPLAPLTTRSPTAGSSGLHQRTQKWWVKHSLCSSLSLWGAAACRHHGELKERPEGRGLWGFHRWVKPGCALSSVFLFRGHPPGRIRSRDPQGGARRPGSSAAHTQREAGTEVAGQRAWRGSPGRAASQFACKGHSLRAEPISCPRFSPVVIHSGKIHIVVTMRSRGALTLFLFSVEMAVVFHCKLNDRSAANPETPNSTICREASTQSSSAAASQGWVLPEGKIMPNTVFVGGIDDRTDEAEIRSCFGRHGSVKEVKMITNRSGVSKGYGFVSFVDDVDVQKIVESQIHLQGKKLKLGPAIRKQKFCARHVQPCPLVFNPPPPPQFQNVWRNPNTETCLQPLITLNPVTQYVQSAANPETPNSTTCREASTQSSSAAASQGWVLPEGKIMPNTVFVGGIDDRPDETEIRSCFGRYGSVKEVKIITNRSGVSKGYGFVSFVDDVDVQKIVESQIHLQGKKLKLGPAIRKQKFCARHVQPCPLVFNPPPPPQFQNVWRNPNTETCLQPLITLNPVTQYVQSAANPETPNSTICREASTQSSSAAASQGWVLPEGKIMPNTVFVGGIDDRTDETEIRSCLGRYGSVKEVKIITNRSGVSKGYGFVSFVDDVDVQKIVESQIHLQGKKLKLGPAIRKQKFCARLVQPRPLVLNPPPPPQFQNIWRNANTETCLQPLITLNPITQYVQAYSTYPDSPDQFISINSVIPGYQLPVYNYQAYRTYPNAPVQVITRYQSPVYNYQAYSTYPDSPGQFTSINSVIPGYQLPVYNYQAYRTYPNAPVQVITRYQSPVYNYQAFPAYPNSPVQVTTGYQLPVYNYQAYRTYPNAPVQVITRYQSPVYNYQAYSTYPDSPGQFTSINSVIPGYQLPVYNYQAYRTYPNAPVQVITRYQSPVYNYQAFPAYPNSPIQVTTGYQLPVYNYQMPLQWPVAEQRRNLWTEAYRWWYLVCLIQRAD